MVVVGDGGSSGGGGDRRLELLDDDDDAGPRRRGGGGAPKSAPLNRSIPSSSKGVVPCVVVVSVEGDEFVVSADDAAELLGLTVLFDSALLLLLPAVLVSPGPRGDGGVGADCIRRSARSCCTLTPPRGTCFPLLPRRCSAAAAATCKQHRRRGTARRRRTPRRTAAASIPPPSSAAEQPVNSRLMVPRREKSHRLPLSLSHGKACACVCVRVGEGGRGSENIILLNC